MFKDITIACPTEECISIGGDDSPHRSTWENTKDWCFDPTFPSSGTTATQVHYFVVTDGSGMVTSATTTTTTIPVIASSTSYSIEIPPTFTCSKEPLDMEVVHLHCPSIHTATNESSVRIHNEDAESIEADSMIFQVAPPVPPQEFSRPKRCRASSYCSMDEEEDQEMCHMGGMSSSHSTTMNQHSPFLLRPPAAKRRRLHSRKPALEAAGFDAILIRLEM